ncbi:MAG: 6-pyruvoyl-tetrahydropterin synthase-related protein [Patescibacteria group bacterium]|nr:6-pyruvoyl-tetrahydropterin synthase-related protein [Patescibacteria group bacterium]
MKKYFYFFVIIFLSILPFVSIFSTNNLPHTHDGTVHLARIAAYYKSLTDLQIPVRWAGDLNYGYGMPLFNFIYGLPYLFSSFFVFLGFGLVSSFKIVLFLSFILSGIFMFLFCKTFFNDDKKALLITILYQFSPFRLVELLVRGSFGEVYTYTFFPLVLFGLTLIFKKNSYRNFIITAVGAALLVLSHNALSLVFFVIAFCFLLYFGKSKNKIFYGLFPLVCGLLLSSFYWIPAILEHKYTHGDLYMKNIYLMHFPPIQNFFIPNLINMTSFQIEGISVQLGLFHVIIILISIWAVLFYKKIDKLTKKVIIFSLLILGISLFFMQPVSKIVWEKIALLRQFQFPWRFLAVASFATSFLGISYFCIKFLQKKFIYFLFLFLVVISTVYYWNPPLGYDRINEKDYWNFPLNTTYFGETDVIWSAGPAKSYPKGRVEVIAGDGRISSFTKKSNIQEFKIDAKTILGLVSHTQYFPGWRVYVDNKVVPIQFQDQNWRGEITFNAPKGVHNIKIVFGENKLRMISDILSLTTLFSMLLFGLFLFFKRR